MRRDWFLHALAALALAAPGDSWQLRADEAAAPTAQATAPQAQATADAAGQADLDDAIEAKLSARTLDDYDRVLKLARQAVEKGLDEQGTKFAEELYTGTLVDRAALVTDRIYEMAGRDPQWPKLRAFAMRDLEEIAKRDPKLGQAQLMIARLEALPQGNRERARTAATAALELLGDDKLQQARAHVVLAGVAEDDAERRKHFDAAVELAPGSAEVRRDRGLFRLMHDEFDAAREDLEAAVTDSPNDPSLHEALGMAYAMSEKLPEARKAFDRAIELAPKEPGPLLQRARLLAVQEEFVDAVADLDRAVALVPENPEPRLLRARIRIQSGDGAGALADLEDVLRREPDNPAGLEMRAALAVNRQDFAAAIRDFRRIVAKRPDDVTLLTQLATLYLLAEQPRKAIERFNRALELDDENFTCRRGRSDALISIGDHEAALADLEVAATLKPDEPSVLNNLAWLLATSPEDELRDGARAIEVATKACENSGWREPHIISTLAAGYAEQGDFENAKKYSRQAVEAGATTAEIQEQLEKELESYEAGKPWRERQEVEDAVLDESTGAVKAPPAAADAKAGDDVDVEEESREPRRPFDED